MSRKVGETWGIHSGRRIERLLPPLRGFTRERLTTHGLRCGLHSYAASRLFTPNMTTHLEFIRQFETDPLPGEFHHVDHVRLAFAYLSEFPALEALERFAAALKRFATARGKATLYHETITHAYFFLIRERMARAPDTSGETFALENSDLLQWKPGILGLYYRESTLRSELARSVFLFPDKIA